MPYGSLEARVCTCVEDKLSEKKVSLSAQVLPFAFAKHREMFVIENDFSFK